MLRVSVPVMNDTLEHDQGCKNKTAENAEDPPRY
jgi:hypothetical protein